MDEQGGSARKRAADAFGHDETQNDYLAEWFVRTSSPYGSTKPNRQYIGACHASRIVDGGVDSQA
jgi:hypothetical protein